MLWSFGLIVLLVDICYRFFPLHEEGLHPEALAEKATIVKTGEIFLNAKLFLKPEDGNVAKLASARELNIPALPYIQPHLLIQQPEEGAKLSSVNTPKDAKFNVTYDKVTEINSQTQRVATTDVGKQSSKEITRATTEDTWETNIHSISDLHVLLSQNHNRSDNNSAVMSSATRTEPSSGTMNTSSPTLTWKFLQKSLELSKKSLELSKKSLEFSKKSLEYQKDT